MATLEAVPADPRLPTDGSSTETALRLRRKVLEVEMRIGRAPDSHLRLDEHHVSNQHAAIRWAGQGWEIRDLGSRNGTSLDGASLQPRVAYALHQGATLAFGSPNQRWRLVDDSPPVPMVVKTNTEDDLTLIAENGLIAVPTADDPELTIYRAHGGQWLGERGHDLEPFEHGKIFEVRGSLYRFISPDLLEGTVGIDPLVHNPLLSETQPNAVRRTPIEFLVSFDEEHVDLVIGSGELSKSLRSRAHFYLLLTLARCRIEDTRNGLPDSACGWRYGDDLCKRLRIPSEQLNVQIFRIRREFSSLGYLDAAEVIERRPSTRQLRVGLDAKFLTITAT